MALFRLSQKTASTQAVSLFILHHNCYILPIDSIIAREYIAGNNETKVMGKHNNTTADHLAFGAIENIEKLRRIARRIPARHRVRKCPDCVKPRFFSTALSLAVHKSNEHR